MSKSFLLLLLSVASILLLSACSKDNAKEPALSHQKLTLLAGQTRKLIYEGECKWSSDEPLIAEVDKDGYVSAKRVGVTNIRANDETCQVTVKPKYDTYMEPYMEWGASINEVIDFMDGYKNLGMTDNIMSFMLPDQDIMYMYTFNNNILISSAIVGNLMTVGTQISDFLLERYVPINVDVSDYTVSMVSIDKNTLILVRYYTEYVIVYYTSIKNSTLNTKTLLDLFDGTLCSEKVHVNNQEINEMIVKFNN